MIQGKVVSIHQKANGTQEVDDISCSARQDDDSTEDDTPDTFTAPCDAKQVEGVKRLTAQERRLRELQKQLWDVMKIHTICNDSENSCSRAPKI